MNQDKLIKWLMDEAEKRKPYSCYDEYHSGMQKMIDDLIIEIEDGTFNEEVKP